MPPARSGGARKGKKSWRKNIVSDNVEDALADASRQAARGHGMTELLDADLYYEDKAPAPAEAAPEPTSAKARARQRLKCSTVKALVSAPNSRRPVAPTQPKKRKQTPATLRNGHPPSLPLTKRLKSTVGSQELDTPVWDRSVKPRLPNEVHCTFIPEAGPTRRRGPTRLNSRVPAVEIDQPGCSYNPDPAQHQDAVAEAVAVEVQQQIRRELQPAPVPLTVEWVDPRQSELDMLQHLEEQSDEDHSGSEGGEGGEAEGGPERTARKAAAKKTTTQRNKARRVLQQEAAQAAKQALKKQRRDIDRAKELEAEAVEAEAASAAVQLRRSTVAEERLVAGPPKLGKHRFEAEKVQVLTSDQLGGGLRKLKAFPLLARERFKSVQKRGAIEPRKRAQVTTRRKKATYVTGESRDKLEERQAAINEMLVHNRKASRQHTRKKKESQLPTVL